MDNEITVRRQRDGEGYWEWVVSSDTDPDMDTRTVESLRDAMEDIALYRVVRHKPTVIYIEESE